MRRRVYHTKWASEKVKVIAVCFVSPRKTYQPVTWKNFKRFKMAWTSRNDSRAQQLSTRRIMTMFIWFYWRMGRIINEWNHFGKMMADDDDGSVLAAVRNVIRMGGWFGVPWCGGRGARQGKKWGEKHAKLDFVELRRADTWNERQNWEPIGLDGKATAVRGRDCMNSLPETGRAVQLSQGLLSRCVV